MADASEALLRMLRELMKKRGLNTAAVADAAGIDRGRVRKVLKGAEPMTVDELLRLGQALHIGPADLGLPDAMSERVTHDAPPPVEAAPTNLGLDPWGNQPEQLFRVGFELGCDFLFLARADDLEGSGVPAHVLTQFAGRDVPIRLDATYHRYNEPRYDAAGVTLTLSFDALYDCRFPWSSVRQVMFFPATPEGAPVAEDDEKPPERPVLRLVT